MLPKVTAFTHTAGCRAVVWMPRWGQGRVRIRSPDLRGRPVENPCAIEGSEATLARVGYLPKSMPRTAQREGPAGRPPSPATALLSGSPVALTRVSWHPRRELGASDWLRQGRWLGSLGRTIGWWLGDWLRYGTAHYGERYTTAARVTGYDEHTLMNMAYVASKFDISRRREKLSFSHHAELAALPPIDQERWLERAQQEELSVHALRTELRREADTGHPSSARLRSSRSRARLSAPPKDSGATAVVCPECGHHFVAAAELR
jgi:hypothetical protein